MVKNKNFILFYCSSRRRIQGVPSARGSGPGWVDFYLVVPPSCTAALLLLPNSSAQAELGREWKSTNSSQPISFHEQMGHPVQCSVAML